MNDHAKTTVDILSLGATIGTVIGMLPAIAALLSIVWTCIRIHEWWRGRKVDE
jgi:hypothetical protein